MAIYTSILTAGANSHAETSENVNGVVTDFVSQGVIGAITNTAGVAPSTGAFAVNAQGTPNMTVAVSSGVAYVTATPSSQNSQTLRVRNTASANVTISANSSGSTKYDWLYIQVDATKAANPASDASDVATLVVSRSSSNTTDNGTPPTYGTLLAVITVANGASSITNGNIADKRVRSEPVGGINDANGNEAIKVAATASAVNEITVTNAATGNSPQIAPSGDDSNINLDLRGKGTGYLVLSNKRNNNGTSAVETSQKIQSGWACAQPGVNSTATISVTFPAAFTNPPIVVAVYGGDTAGVTSTLGSGGINVKQAYADATSITTTGCSLVAATRDSTSWAANNTVYIHWMAIGA